jgi:hypothetical protein
MRCCRVTRFVSLGKQKTTLRNMPWGGYRGAIYKYAYATTPEPFQSCFASRPMKVTG